MLCPKPPKPSHVLGAIKAWPHSTAPDAPHICRPTLTAPARVACDDVQVGMRKRPPDRTRERWR